MRQASPGRTPLRAYGKNCLDLSECTAYHCSEDEAYTAGVHQQRTRAARRGFRKLHGRHGVEQLDSVQRSGGSESQTPHGLGLRPVASGYNLADVISECRIGFECDDQQCGSRIFEWGTSGDADKATEPL